MTLDKIKRRKGFWDWVDNITQERLVDLCLLSFMGVVLVSVGISIVMGFK